MLVLHHTKSRNFTRTKIRHTLPGLIKPIGADGKFNISKFLEGILKDAKRKQEQPVTTEKLENYDFMALDAEKAGTEKVMRREDDREELLYDFEDGGLQNPLFK